MRSHYNEEEREAARILDLVKAGGEVAPDAVIWSLWVLGDLVGGN